MENFKGTKGSDLTYPLSTEELSDRFYDGVEIQAGLTKREYFAAMAMQGITSNDSFNANINMSRSIAGTYAKDSVKLADALIEALNK